MKINKISERVYTMVTQFVSAFIVIGLIVFLGIVMTIGVMNSKARQARLPGRTEDHPLNAGE